MTGLEEHRPDHLLVSRTCDESGYIVIEVQPKTLESQGNRTVAFRLESDDAFATMTFIQ